MIIRKSSIKFKGRVHSKKGVLSMLLGFASLITFAVISFISGNNQGNGGIELGLIGLLCAACSVFGFILSTKSFKEKDIYLNAPITGLIVNGVMVVVFFSLYIVGILS